MKVENVRTQPLQNENNRRHMATATEKVSEKNNENQEKEVINKEEIKTVVDKLNEFTKPLHTNLKFEFHEKLEEYYVTVVNPENDEVIKEIPPKKMLDMYAAMAEFMGILVDEKI